jgi:thiol-disulfide isomerase/thioredoxin
MKFYSYKTLILENTKMKSKIFLFYIFLLLKSSVQKPYKGNHVITLDESTYQNGISEHKFTLVKFFAPWCIYCQQFAPEFESSAARLYLASSQIRLAEVNCDIDNELCDQYSIQSYPQVFLFKNGQLIEEYDMDLHGTKEKGITLYMLKILTENSDL